MPHATLSIVALLLVATFVLNHRVVNSATDSGMERSEVEILASAVADEVFAFVGTLDFDATGEVSSPDRLTPTDSFGASPTWDAATSIEELHGHTAQLRARGVSGQRDFEVTVEVDYVLPVGDDFVPADSPQLLKRVSLIIAGPNGFQARQERIYGPDATV